ncbi:hypothetical protein [Sorangium sp. So ce513]|uniref:hypothetical protein n=1 Tax=Sorangium sp. So ce513 TaxID=3133315 RepID=UPI003F63F591
MNEAASDAAFFGCVVESCPGAAAEVSEVVRCQLTAGRGACEDVCAADADGCAACMAEACAPDVAACEAARCEG